jgi:hypothetical protein
MDSALPGSGTAVRVAVVVAVVQLHAHQIITAHRKVSASTKVRVGERVGESESDSEREFHSRVGKSSTSNHRVIGHEINQGFTLSPRLTKAGAF